MEQYYYIILCGPLRKEHLVKLKKRIKSDSTEIVGDYTNSIELSRSCVSVLPSLNRRALRNRSFRMMYPGNEAPV